MFTIKFYSSMGYRQIIEEADSVTVLRQNGEAEITLHRKSGEDCRRDIKDDGESRDPSYGHAQEPGPARFDKAIIENMAGKTTEIVTYSPIPGTSSVGIRPKAA